MTKEELIAYIQVSKLQIARNEIYQMPVRNVFQKMNSFFLHNMRSPNTGKVSVKGLKGKKPAKYLKWFNSEER